MISEAVGAPAHRNIGGVEYEFHPLRIKHMGYIEQWMKDSTLRQARDIIREIPDATEKDKARILEEAYKTCSRLNFGSPQAEMFLGSVAGLHQMIWQSMRQGREITLQQVEDLICTRELVIEIGEVVMNISGLSEDQPIPFPQSSSESVQKT